MSRCPGAPPKREPAAGSCEAVTNGHMDNLSQQLIPYKCWFVTCLLFDHEEYISEKGTKSTEGHSEDRHDGHCTKSLMKKKLQNCHLQDPFRVFQSFEEGVFGVGGVGTGSASPQQLLKGALHLPHVCEVHRYQFTVQRGVHSEALHKVTHSTGLSM